MFQLKSGTDTYDFDIDGSVQLAGAAVGTWTTDKTNQIVLTPTAGGAPTVFVVDWLFNNNNQLQILSGGAQVFNFHQGTALPLYSNLKDVLVVQPDSAAPFTFELRGTWAFNANNELTIQLGTQLSTFDGFLQDSSGQFSYHFFDLANPATGNESVLQFPGTWVHTVENGKSVVVLHYDTEDGKGGDFTLPGTINLDPSINEFVYNYDKGTDSFSLQFVGTLHISSDFTISYKLDRDSTASGPETTFSLDAQFNKTDFNGDLELTLKNTAGGSTAITVGGNFTAVLGGNTLDVGFHFTQPASGNTQAFGFNGEFKSKDGSTDLTWDFERSSTSTSVSLSGHFKIGPASIEDRFTLTAANGQITGIHELFGISF
jgi:hypothetical protein